MPGTIRTVLLALAQRRRTRRRAANLRAASAARDGSGSRAGVKSTGAATPASPRRAPAIALAGIVAALLGCVLLAGHARHLVVASADADAVASTHDADLVRSASAYQSVLPGAAFTVPSAPGIAVSLQPGGALLTASGMRAAPPVHIDLCSQLRAPADASDRHLVPLRLGYRFDDVQRWVTQSRRSAQPLALRNVLLLADRPAAAGPEPDPMPEVRISGNARADFADPLSEPLQLSWSAAPARWIGDASLGQVEQGPAGQVNLRQQGWLLWGAGSALRIERRANLLCPQAGELLVQVYRAPVVHADPEADTTAAPADGDSRALVVAFPARGNALAGYLAPGRYRVPAEGPAPLEDQSLFETLQARGLLRLNGAGAIELAPRDLTQWRAAALSERAAALDGWRQASLDPAAPKLLKRLYYQADGAYLRQQVDIYNGERSLLAWRQPATRAALAGQAGSVGPAAREWRASIGRADAGNGGIAAYGVTNGTSDGAAAAHGASGAVMLAVTPQMPPAAARLFATLPQGWQAWTRVGYWPQSASAQGGRPLVHLALELPRMAAGGESLQLMVAGHVVAVSGATMRLHPVCTGRACAAPSDVQQVDMTVDAGARAVRLEVRALAMCAPEERKYRHLKLDAGRLIWQPLAAPQGASGAPDTAARLAARLPSPVLLHDRDGALLWADGAPSAAAQQAGLAPLLGIGPDHASSIAGMLARLPLSPSASTGGAAGGVIDARLTLELPLQALGQRVLECVGMRRGRWSGQACDGGQAPPPGRHAGLVVIDTETGDVLVAAGAGAGEVSAANWAEVRDFDRGNPARSALRLPALQHDGGAHQSPGSTFKVVSALGLELAARNDPQLDALLGGMPLPAINRLARERGYGFQTDAASYPLDVRQAHITNYREQSLDRRAQDGRLGLAQALTYSLNTWFAWSGELSDRSLFGRPDGGAPDLQPLDANALDSVRPIVAAAHRLGFEQALRLDGGLLPADFSWRNWDALQATPAHIDAIHTRHELRQMAIGLRMQVTPLQMALAAGAIGQGHVVTPRLLLALDQASSKVPDAPPLGIRLDRIRAGMKGVVDVGTGAGAFGAPALAALRRGLYGKTGTAPSGDDSATVWFTGWLEPGALPGRGHRLAIAAFVSHSEASGGEHAAPVVAALLATLVRNPEQKGK